MDVAGLLEPVSAASRQLAGRVRESSAFFPQIRRKRRVLALWLLTAHGAQLFLLSLVLFMLAGFPRVRDASLNRVFPESFSGRLAGALGGESDADRRRHVAGTIVTTLFWISGGALATLLFWVRIPETVNRSIAIAKRREAEGDALLASTPTRSVLLYRSALALACDDGHERVLRDKLDRLDGRLSPDSRTVVSSTTGRDDGGKIAGRYTITNELGRGANGVVYRARDEVLGREVALKALPGHMSDDDFVAPRFRQEARALAKLNHPNIVQVYDFIEHDKRMWTAIELVEGGDLATCLAGRGPLSVQEACGIGAGIAEAVAFAHDRGVIHRDLKPLNVLLAGGKTPKVTDFGLAKLAEGGVDTLEGTIMGSPHYMSPEQASGKPIGFGSDIYSLGVILYQMLAGHVPFDGEIAGVLAQHIRKPPRRLRDAAVEIEIPPDLDKLVMAMLAKSAGKRPPMDHIARALSGFGRVRSHA